ncbi:MAG: SUMF1/EgtB/PvdO family nonheme iron enzyme [Nitrospinae bacterium]|nr:SUMF1/EgtB/PvdO family nonheme iron enzyme [Nitrospinota bacterium]
MKRTICLILIWSLAVGCSMLPFGKKETLPEPTPQQKAAEPREALASEEPPTLIETGTPLAPKSAEKPRQKIVKKTPPRPTYRKRKKLVLPTYLNAKDNTLMALITEGDYLVGGNLIPNYKRAFIPGLTQNKIQSFYIDQYEITVGNFKKYNPEYDEKPFYEGRECPTCPAMGIDWKSANKYCQRAGKSMLLACST